MNSLEQSNPSGHLITAGLFVTSQFHVKEFKNNL